MIYYTKVKRNITTGYNPGEKYLAVISRNGVLTQEQLADRIASASSLAYNDVLSAIAALQMEIVDATMNGVTVRLDQLGNFTPYLEAKAMGTEIEADSTSINRTKVIFFPNVRFKNRLKSTGYIYRDPMPKGFIDPNAPEPVVP